MTSAMFDFTPLLPAGLPAPAAKWAGLAKYSFVGGNNDPDQVPVEGLVDAVNAVLKREGRALATYGLASGPQGYLPLRQFLTRKLKRDAGIESAADDIVIVSGSLQALDLVNATLLTRGDTVIIERDTYQGALNRLTRLEWSTDKTYAGSRLRLCFASPSHEQIREGIARLAEVCRREFGVPARSANVEIRASI